MCPYYLSFKFFFIFIFVFSCFLVFLIGFIAFKKKQVKIWTCFKKSCNLCSYYIAYITILIINIECICDGSSWVGSQTGTDHVHREPAGGAGESFPGNTLSWRSHQRPAHLSNAAVWGKSTGTARCLLKTHDFKPNNLVLDNQGIRKEYFSMQGCKEKLNTSCAVTKRKLFFILITY